MLEGEKVRLRPVKQEDIDMLYLWENEYDNQEAGSTSGFFSLETLKQFIDSAQDIYMDNQVRFMISRVDNKQAVGCVDLFDFDPVHLRAGVGILITPGSERGNGFATEALNLLINHAFSSIGMHQLFCTIASDNISSLRLFEKHGFRVSGTRKDWLNKAGEWRDVHFLQLINTNKRSHSEK